jgi:hypothetical protein
MKRGSVHTAISRTSLTRSLMPLYGTQMATRQLRLEHGEDKYQTDSKYAEDYPSNERRIEFGLWLVELHRNGNVLPQAPGDQTQSLLAKGSCVTALTRERWT